MIDMPKIVLPSGPMLPQPTAPLMVPTRVYMRPAAATVNEQKELRELYAKVEAWCKLKGKPPLEVGGWKTLAARIRPLTKRHTGETLRQAVLALLQLLGLYPPDDEMKDFVKSIFGIEL